MEEKSYLIFARHSAWDLWELAAEAETPGEALARADEQQRLYYHGHDAEVLILQLCGMDTLLIDEEVGEP